MTHRQEAIQEIVALQEVLRQYEEQIQRLESKRDRDYGDLSRHLRDLNAIQQRFQQETANLVTALRHPRVHDRRDGVPLRRVVELAGMLCHCAITEQQAAGRWWRLPRSPCRPPWTP